MAITLETERLYMREMNESDAKDMFDLNSDPDVTQYTGDGPFTDLEETRSFIKGYDQYQKYQMGRLNIFLKITDEYIGWCGLKYHPATNNVDLGYRLHKRYWGKGYATEASIASLNYGFNTLHLQEIIATAMNPNIASITMMQKLGMVFSHNDSCGNQPGVVYKITNDQWK